MQALAHEGATRADFYITNVYRLRPHNTEGKNRAPHQKEINSRWPLLRDELKVVRPSVVSLLGAIAIRTLLTKNSHSYEGVEAHRSRQLSLNGCRYVATFHPSRSHPELQQDVTEFVRVWKNSWHDAS